MTTILLQAQPLIEEALKNMPETEMSGGWLALLISFIVSFVWYAVKKADKWHSQAMEKFDALIEQNQSLVSDQKQILQHNKEQKYSQQEQEKTMLIMNETIEHEASEIEKNTKSIKSLNTSINNLSKKIKCQEPA